MAARCRSWLSSARAPLPFLPSRLPTWKGFNNLLLESLCERLNEYSSNRQPTAQMLAVFRARRDQTRFLAPDFQAQLMEEEVGADYFSVWQSLETRVFGPVHAGLADLAVRGRLTAIITTNFDQLIETALDERGVATEVFFDAAGFERLSGLKKGRPGGLPIIKIHGSIEDAPSLVDTLRQRLVGRPESLNAALQLLLRRSPWLYLGFSGADFGYDPHYLGVLDAAKRAKGFLFVHRPGRPLEPGVAILIEAYGAAKATAVEAELPTWLFETFDLPAWTAPAAIAARSEAEATARVQERIRDWVGRLGPVSVVNIVCSMLKSAGLDHAAFWLLRKTFKSYRTPDDTETTAYQRYNYNYGVSLLEAGLIRNPIVREDSNLLEWKTYADQNAFEFLARSYKQGNLLAGGGQLASLLAYRGQVGDAIALATEVTDKAEAAVKTDGAVRPQAWLELCDIAIASVVVYDIVQYFTAPAEQLRLLATQAAALGDEPRRAMLCAHLGRLLTYTGHFDEADASLQEAEVIARRLDLSKPLVATRAARGLWLADSGTSPEDAVQTLTAVADELRAIDDEALVTHYDLGDPTRTPTVLKGRQPMLCRVLLDLTRAAMMAGRARRGRVFA